MLCYAILWYLIYCRDYYVERIRNGNEIGDGDLGFRITVNKRGREKGRSIG